MINNLNHNNCNNLPNYLGDSSISSGQRATKYLQIRDNRGLLPKEVLKIIYSFIKPIELANYCTVSTLWNQLIDTIKYPQNVIDNFANLLEKKVLAWNQIGKYISLSSAQEERFARLNQGKIKYGQLLFSIDSKDIKIQRNGFQISILKGEEDKNLIALRLEGNYLYALREDGIIVEWNYLTGEQIQKIELPYAKNNPHFFDESTKPYVNNGFLVSQGFIVMVHGTGNFIEIINVNNLKNYKLINTGIGGFRKIVLKNNNLYMFTVYDLFIYNFPTQKAKLIKNLPPLYKWGFEDAFVDNNRVYFTFYRRQENSLSFVDLTTKSFNILTEKFEKKLSIEFSKFTAKIDDVLIGEIQTAHYDQETGARETVKELKAYDLKAKKIIKSVKLPARGTITAEDLMSSDLGLIPFLEEYNKRSQQSSCLIS